MEKREDLERIQRQRVAHLVFKHMLVCPVCAHTAHQYRINQEPMSVHDFARILIQEIMDHWEIHQYLHEEEILLTEEMVDETVQQIHHYALAHYTAGHA